VVDPLLGDGAVHGELVDALRETVTLRVEMVQTQAVSTDDLPESGMRRVKARRYEETVFRLTPEEVERGERAVEGLSGVNRDYAEVLLEVAGKIPIESSGDVVILSLAAVVGACLDEEDLDGAMFVLDQLGSLEAQRWCPGGSVGFVAGDAVTADRLRELLQKVREGDPESFAKTERFLQRVRRWITPSLLEILTEAGDRNVRKTVLEILGEQNAVPWPDLEPLLRDTRWYVVRNAVQLAAQMGHEEIADHTGRLLSHPDVRVKRETVRALGQMNSQAALRGLTQALSDQDPSVRTLAAHAVGRKGGSEQKALLLARIQDRIFASLSPEEMEAFLGAYAELVQDRAVPLLERLWKKSILSAKPLPLRVAAVLALGHVRGQAGAISLKAASTSNEPKIRRAAADAVQRASARRLEDQR
jgi:HEAT repeat protein